MLANRTKSGIKPDRAHDVVLVFIASCLPTKPRHLALVGPISEHFKDPALVSGEAFRLGRWFWFVLESNLGRLDLDAGREISGDRDAAALESNSSVDEESRSGFRRRGSSELR